ncbi:branched-chain amino acid ABC transporter substrate-binding protein [Sphaerimonospora cavernae]|uniref:Branched-chain amino acid ABC transporter substrate-binding protein n=1 Tax=Sphaerimonospora cavernae TaxID=1740611 RepID=A0ABV6U4P8_9ACTN
MVRRRAVVKSGALLVVGALALAACGTRADETGSGSGGDQKVVKIGVIAPLTGNLSAIGLGIRNSVDLAIRQANEQNAIPGWKIELRAEDDQATPQVGQQAASTLADDTAVAGVVGTYNSSVAQNVMPVLDKASIVQVSPGNTGPALTMGEDLDNPKRPYHNYFRTCTTDAIQGPFGARYVYNTLGIKKIATINDKKTYGVGLVAQFTKEFKALGGEVVSEQTINPDDTDYSSVIAKVAAAKPDLLYYGGEYPQAGPLSRQMKARGLNVALMGGDGIVDPKYIELGGDTSVGDFGTSVGAPVESLDSAKAFVEAYDKAGFSETYSAYGAYAFDAANAIINGLKVSLKDATEINKDVREATIQAVQNISFEGTSGHVAFDEFGDNTTKILTVYKVDGDKWAPAHTDTFK